MFFYEFSIIIFYKINLPKKKNLHKLIRLREEYWLSIIQKILKKIILK